MKKLAYMFLFVGSLAFAQDVPSNKVWEIHEMNIFFPNGYQTDWKPASGEVVMKDTVCIIMINGHPLTVNISPEIIMYNHGITEGKIQWHSNTYKMTVEHGWALFTIGHYSNGWTMIQLHWTDRLTALLVKERTKIQELRKGG